jgi:hypothetical protein
MMESVYFNDTTRLYIAESRRIRTDVFCVEHVESTWVWFSGEIRFCFRTDLVLCLVNKVGIILYPRSECREV